MILNPAVPKRLLLFTAGLFWFLIACRILLLCYKYYQLSSLSNLLIILSGFSGYVLFFYMVFFRLIKKHTIRIINKNEKACIFGFFDFKSYMIIFFMIALGLLIVKVFHINANFLAIFFMMLGLSLLTSSFYFFYYLIRYQYSLKKFIIK